MIGIEWVVHTSLLRAADTFDLDAWEFLIEVRNHHILAMDGETGWIHQHYIPWLSQNPKLNEWFQRMVKKAGGVVNYPSNPRDDTLWVELAGLGLTDEHPFVDTARQTQDRVLASDLVTFPPDAQEYLAAHLSIRIVTNWQVAIQHGQLLTEARVRWLIGQDEGESVEFKQSLTTQLRKRAIKTLAAFAAKDGGHVFFGVRNDRTICGVQVGRNTLERLAEEILSNTTPSLTAPHLRLQMFPLSEGIVVAASVDPIPGRECRAYGYICRRAGRRTECEKPGHGG
jgi:hypothetical protein